MNNDLDLMKLHTLKELQYLKLLSQRLENRIMRLEIHQQLVVHAEKTGFKPKNTGKIQQLNIFGT